MLKKLHPRKVCFVINALDKCTEDLSKLIDLMSQSAPSSTPKWIVSSRPNTTIRSRLRGHQLLAKLDLGLEETAQHVSQAVDAFIDHALLDITWLHDDEQLCTRVRDELSRRSGGSFFWVSHVVKELRVTDRWDVDSVMDRTPETLAKVYRRMLKQINQLNEGTFKYCREILSCTAAAYRPVSLRELGVLSRLPNKLADDPKSIASLVGMCGFLLNIQHDAVHFIHQSARDFLIQEQDWFTTAAGSFVDIPGEGRFWKEGSNSLQEIHTRIVERSLEAMSSKLRRDIYSLGVPGASTDRDKRPSPDPLATIHYSCLYWVDHLEATRKEPREVSRWTRPEKLLGEDGVATQFLRQHLLHWLEALSLIGNLSAGLLATANLERLVHRHLAPSSSLKELIHDANRFLCCFQSCIERYPLQVYYSALVFAPSKSPIPQIFSKERPRWITAAPTVEEQWNVLRQTIKAHSDPVLSTTFSSKTHELASISEDGSVRLWDGSTGLFLHMLNTHPRSVLSAVFFDHRTLLAAMNDGTVQVWRTQFGTLQQILTGHVASVSSATFWNDLLAFGCCNGTVVLYQFRMDGDAISMCLQRTLEGHEGSIKSVVLSSHYVVSLSSQHSIRIWEAKTGHQLHHITGHAGCGFTDNDAPLSVAIHSLVLGDGWLASALSDGTVRLWDIKTGQSWHTLQGHAGPVLSIDFSQSGQYLASASADKTVRPWNIMHGSLTQILLGHTDAVLSVGFLELNGQLASTSADGTIRLWDTTPRTRPMSLSGSSVNLDWILEAGGNHEYVRALSADCQRLATAVKGAVHIWDLQTSSLEWTFDHHKQHIKSLAFSPDGQRLASASLDKTVGLWNLETGELLHIIGPHDDIVSRVAFSPDGKLLVSAAAARGDLADILRVWDVTEGSMTQGFGNDKCFVAAVAFSPDGQRVAWGSDRRNHKAIPGGYTGYVDDHCNLLIVRGLLGMGHKTKVFYGHDSAIYSIAFSPDGRRIGSVSTDGILRIWDANKGVLQQTVRGHITPDKYIVPSTLGPSIAFSPDGSQLALGSPTPYGTVKLWDSKNGALLRMFQGHTGPIYSVNFSPDGDQLVTTSTDGTLRRWDTKALSMWGTDLAESACRLSLTDDLTFASDADTITQCCKSSSPGLRETSSVQKQETDSRSNGWGFSSDGCWITWKERNILWLPPDYRPVASSVEPHGVKFRCSSGRVLSIGFSADASRYLSSKGLDS
ncbi:WD40-repeat-containing domain protein [Ilyonectria destructans]|nr:WD40-repeat-containing domain protein [Ilyonectria destructans]